MDAVIQLAKQRFKLCQDADSHNRNNAKEDLRFAYGEQWPEALKKEREADNQPCLTINKIPSFVRQVVNDIRQVRPAIKTRPVDSGSDVETAEVINGMVRAIEKSCNAESAYDWATEYAIKMGFGYYRITTDYADDYSFDQDLKIKRILNPFSVYIDPNAQEHDKSDMRYAFVVDDMPKEEFKSKYPGHEGQFDDASEGLSVEQWVSEDTVRIAEYWCVEEETFDISLLEDGTVVSGKIKGSIATRQATQRKVIQRVITGFEVLEETEWQGKYIPIIPVYGVEENIEGETFYHGMVRDMKDSMRMYNYTRSATVEKIALAPKAPYIGPELAFADNPKWKHANTKNYAYLSYKGTMMPQRQQGAPIEPALIQESQTTSEELKQITGIYDPGLGDRSNEVSGTAINARKVQSNISNFHFVDNLARSLRHTGRILVDLIPKIYSGERLMKILKADGSEEEVMLNRQYIDQKTGKEKYFDLTAGKYDVVVDIGPSYATQRQEAAESMLEVLRAFPQAAEVIGDLVAKNMDWPESDEISKRLKMLLPASIVAEENPHVRRMLDENKQIVEQGKQYIGYLETQIQDLMKRLSDRDRELSVKEREAHRKEIETGAKIATDAREQELSYQIDIPGQGVTGLGYQQARSEGRG